MHENPDTGSPEQRALHYGNTVALEILTHKKTVADEIVRLFREEGLKSEDIGVRMNGSMGLPHDLTDATRGSIVRRVLRELVPEQERADAANRHYRNNLLANQDLAGEARDEWMRREGMFVWSDEHNVHFWTLVADESMFRPFKPGKERRLNHPKIAEAMNQLFPGAGFTSVMCADHYRTHRYMEKKRQEKAAQQQSSPDPA